jgi:hypothetical protein
MSMYDLLTGLDKERVLHVIYLFWSINLSVICDRWFFLGTPVSSTNKTDHHDITEILLKVALNTITLTPSH